MCAEAAIRRSEVRVPYWFVVLCAAHLPTWRLVSRRRTLCSRNGGFTDVYGYDLTGNVSGVCPECWEAASRW